MGRYTAVDNNRGRVIMEIKLDQIEEVRRELGDAKAKRLRQLKLYTTALVEMALCHSTEGSEDLTNCLLEVNEILAEAGIVSNR